MDKKASGSLIYAELDIKDQVLGRLNNNRRQHVASDQGMYSTIAHPAMKPDAAYSTFDSTSNAISENLTSKQQNSISTISYVSLTPSVAPRPPPRPPPRPRMNLPSSESKIFKDSPSIRKGVNETTLYSAVVKDKNKVPDLTIAEQHNSKTLYSDIVKYKQSRVLGSKAVEGTKVNIGRSEHDNMPDQDNLYSKVKNGKKERDGEKKTESKDGQKAADSKVKATDEQNEKTKYVGNDVLYASVNKKENNEALYSKVQKKDKKKRDENNEDLYSKVQKKDKKNRHENNEDLYSKVQKKDKKNRHENNEDLYSKVQKKDKKNRDENIEVLYSKVQKKDKQNIDENYEDLDSKVQKKDKQKRDENLEILNAKVRKKDKKYRDENNEALYFKVRKDDKENTNVNDVLYSNVQKKNKNQENESNEILYSKVQKEDTIKSYDKESEKDDPSGALYAKVIKCNDNKKNNTKTKALENETNDIVYDITPPILPSRASRDLPELPVKLDDCKVSSLPGNEKACVTVKRLRYSSIAVVIAMSLVLVTVVAWRINQNQDGAIEYSKLDNDEKQSTKQQKAVSNKGNSNSNNKNLHKQDYSLGIAFNKQPTKPTSTLPPLNLTQHKCQFAYRRRFCYKLSRQPKPLGKSQWWCTVKHNRVYLSFESLDEFDFVSAYLNRERPTEDYWLTDIHNTRMAPGAWGGFACHELRASNNHLVHPVMDCYGLPHNKVRKHAMCKKRL